MMEKKKFRSIVKCFCLMIIFVFVFTGCSQKSSNLAKDRVYKSHIATNLPEELKVHVVKLHSEKLADRVYGAMMLSKMGRKAVRAVPHLIEILHEKNDTQLIKPVIEALGKIGDRRAVKPLLAILNDRTSDFRADAAKALGIIGDSRAVLALSSTLTDKAVVNRAVIENSVWALGEIGDETSVEPLISVIKSRADIVAKALDKIDPNWQISGAAMVAVSDLIREMRDISYDEQRVSKVIDALSKFGKPAVGPLFIMLMDDNVHTRKSAAIALDKIGWEPSLKTETIIYLIANQNWDALAGIGKPAHGQLVATLSDKDEKIRLSAYYTLTKLRWNPSNINEKINYYIAGQRWGELLKIGQPAIEPLSRMIRDKSSYIRENVAELLVRMGTPSMKVLIAALKDGNMIARKLAEASLNKIDPDWKASHEAVQAVPEFILSLEAGDSDTRASAAWALSIIKDKRAVEPLILTLEDFDPGVRLYAAKSLGEIGDSRAVMPLIMALNDTDSAVRGYAALALGKIKEYSALDSLINLLMDRDSWPRECAGKALNKIDPEWQVSEAAKRVLPDIVARLKDSDKKIQIGAVKVLGDIQDESTVMSLIEMLNDEDDDIRSIAARALGKIGDSRAVMPLINSLKKNKGDSAAAMIFALGQIMDVRAITPLIEAMDDEDARADAVRALGKITGEHFGEDILKWKDWWDNTCKHSMDLCLFSAEK